MNFIQYQEQARSFAAYPTHLSALYPTIGLAGETGEVSELVKKAFRDKEGVFDSARLAAVKKELGDVLWYVANIASDLGLDLDAIAQGNIDKLTSRKERGVIHGSGDNR